MEGFFLCLTRLTTFCPLPHENKFSLPTTEQNQRILSLGNLKRNTFSSVVIIGSTKQMYFLLL